MRLFSGLAALAMAAGLAAPASASILTYNLIPNSSDVVVTATISGGAFTNASVLFNGSASWQLNLSSGSITLDSGTPALDAFLFGDSSTGAETVSISGGPTIGALSLTNVLVQSTQNPDTTLSGTNPYGLSTTNVMDSANYSFTPTGGSAHTGSLSNSGTTITGTIATGSSPPLSFAQSDTIQLGTMSITEAGTTYTLTLKGDTNFEGSTTVPLPPSAWLLAAGLGLLAFLWKRPPARVPRALYRTVAAAALAVVFCGASAGAAATTLNVIPGGGGLDGTALCPSGDFLCGSGQSDALVPPATNPVSGSFNYNSAMNQLSFSLTLTQAVTFTGSGGSETFEAGTTFTGNAIPVSTPTGASGTVSAENVSGAAETLYYVTSSNSTQQTLMSSALLISSLNCQTIGPSQQCGLILGTGGNEIPVGAIGSQGYDGVLGFNVNVSAVPLPAAVWLLVSGLGGLLGFGARARARA